MKLEFLGTGAADYPKDFSKNDGSPRYMRRYSSALVNSDMMIDPGPHIYDYEEKLGTPGMLRGVTTVILTHSHGDHYNPDSLERLCREAGHTVDFYADEHAFLQLEGRDIPNLVCHPLTAAVPFETDVYEIMPCRSNHDLFFTGEQSLNFIVREKSSGRSFFYGADSGWIMLDTWKLIKKARPEAVIFEATMGDKVPGDDRVFGHTSIPMIEIMMQTMRAQHGPADDCKYYTTHMARTLHGTHEETAAALAPMGVVPAYDGMKIEI